MLSTQITLIGPLMALFNSFYTGTWDRRAYSVYIVSNSTVSGFKFDIDQKCVAFNVTGEDEIMGFCRAAIPKALLWAEDRWTITVGGQPNSRLHCFCLADYRLFSDEEIAYIYFTYSHSTKTIVE